METGAGSQIALESNTRSPPFLAHQLFPGGRSRDNMIGGRQIPYASLVYPDASTNQHSLGSLENGQFNGHGKEWDVKTWEWDSRTFRAQPSSSASIVPNRSRGSQNGSPDGFHHLASSDGICLRPDEGHNYSPDLNGSSEHDEHYSTLRRKQPVSDLDSRSYADKTQPFLRDGSSPEEDTESLSLKLGGHSYAYSDDGNVSREAKRYRSTSPGHQIPACQVDECKNDLSHAKDYHRRHKVCEMHAKATKALVSRIMQRFCQQCSRFHSLAEFDEGKRSCRRRLAGHNRRRRKNQPDTPVGRGYVVPDEDGAGKAAGLVGFFNILSSLQAVNSVGALNGFVNENDALLQYLKKVPLSTPVGLENLTAASIANLVNMNGVVGETGRTDFKSQPNVANSSASRATETDARINSLAPNPTEALSLLLHSSLRGQFTSALLKAAETPLVQVGQGNGNTMLPATSSSMMMADNGLKYANGEPIMSLSSPMASRPLPIPSPMVSGPLSGHQLAPPPRHNGIHQQFAAEKAEVMKANRLQGQVVPVPVAQNMYPMAPANMEDNGATVSTGDLEAPVSTISFMHGQDGRLLQDVESFHARPTIDLQQPSQQYDLNESSPSESDQSPSSSYDLQDHTCRISIKLFDKNPGDLPHSLRSQILNWLAKRPSDMESYIRPGCTVLTIFVSMPKTAWEEFERDLRISLPVLASSHEFWSQGRIQVQLDRRTAYIICGTAYIAKPLKPANIPQLISVSPIAVVAGKTTRLLLRGYNLKDSETRILSAYQGKYTVKLDYQEVKQTETSSTDLVTGRPVYNELSISFDGGVPDVLGRAFIEVQKERGGGNALPVIVADGPICAELQTLEESMTFCTDAVVKEKRILWKNRQQNMDARNFLNELGWLFQRSRSHGVESGLEMFPSRQKHLLVFAVKQDWCAVVEKLLDTSLEMVSNSAELLEIFGDEVSLLHIAVTRRCRPMVKLLLSYVPGSGVGDVTLNLLRDFCKHGSQHLSIFTPDWQSDGVTPLHIAVTMDGAEGIIEELTSDPNQIGLDAWFNSHNSEQMSPSACALKMRKVSYVQLVNRKIAARNGALAIDIPVAQMKSKGLLSKKASSAGGALELPVWSKKDRPEKTKEGKQTLMYPSSCRHLPPNLRGFRGQSRYKPFLISMVAIAAVCVCACLVMRGGPEIKDVLHAFSWRALAHGPK